MQSDDLGFGALTVQPSDLLDGLRVDLFENVHEEDPLRDAHHQSKVCLSGLEDPGIFGSFSPIKFETRCHQVLLVVLSKKETHKNLALSQGFDSGHHNEFIAGKLQVLKGQNHQF